MVEGLIEGVRLKSHDIVATITIIRTDKSPRIAFPSAFKLSSERPASSLPR
jgi:hypothetical protein